MSFRSFRKEVIKDKEYEYKGEKFKVKQFIGYAEKKMLVDNVINSSFKVGDSGFIYCDELLFNVSKVFYVLNFYTDFTLPSKKN
ncbi:MAG: hypothetical protein ACOCUV_02520, partial [bacterium]